MNKKYYADIDLYFDTRKYGIVGDINMKKKEIVDMVKEFGEKLKLTCNTKSKKFYDANGKEVGSFTIASRTI